MQCSKNKHFCIARCVHAQNNFGGQAMVTIITASTFARKTGAATLAGPRRQRSTLAAAPVLFAHAVVTATKTTRSFISPTTQTYPALQRTVYIGTRGWCAGMRSARQTRGSRTAHLGCQSHASSAARGQASARSSTQCRTQENGKKTARLTRT